MLCGRIRSISGVKSKIFLSITAGHIFWAVLEWCQSLTNTPGRTPLTPLFEGVSLLKGGSLSKGNTGSYKGMCFKFKALFLSYDDDKFWFHFKIPGRSITVPCNITKRTFIFKALGVCMCPFVPNDTNQ